jgi:hypothetical protein
MMGKNGPISRCRSRFFLSPQAPKTTGHVRSFVYNRGTTVKHWLDEYPPLRIMHKRIAAAEYNRIRLGLLHERLPWRVPIKGMRCLLGILDEKAWICVDECQNDLPILAWTNFQTAQRTALDAPMECELRLYHMHAGLVMGTALEALAEAVARQNTLHSAERYSVSRIKR